MSDLYLPNAGLTTIAPPPRDDRMFALLERLGVEPAPEGAVGTRWALNDGDGGHVAFLVTDIANAFLDIAERVIEAAQETPND